MQRWMHFVAGRAVSCIEQVSEGERVEEEKKEKEAGRGVQGAIGRQEVRSLLRTQFLTRSRVTGSRGGGGRCSLTEPTLATCEIVFLLFEQIKNRPRRRYL